MTCSSCLCDEFVDYVIVGGLCYEFVDYVIVGGLCDEYYMFVMNIIYACDDICDLCEYLRLLEKKKKKKNSSSRANSNALGEGGVSDLRGIDLRREQNA
jgi:hypothetical protein